MLTEEQLKRRARSIGGSDVGAILGVSPYKTPIDVFIEKTIGSCKETNEKQEENMYIGSAIEDALIDMFVKRNNLYLHSKGGFFEKENYPYVHANVDAILIENANPVILEVKTAGTVTSEWIGEEGYVIPKHYYWQIAHYCWVTGINKAYLSVRFLANKENADIVYTFNDHDKIILEREIPRFWNEYVLKEKIPDPINMEDVKYLYKNLGTLKVIDDTLIKIDQLKSVKNQIKELEAIKDALKNEIVTKLGGYGEIIDLTDTKIASFRQQKTRRLNVERLKKERIEIYNQYMDIKFIDIFNTF